MTRIKWTRAWRCRARVDREIRRATRRRAVIARQSGRSWRSEMLREVGIAAAVAVLGSETPLPFTWERVPGADPVRERRAILRAAMAYVTRWSIDPQGHERARAFVSAATCA